MIGCVVLLRAPDVFHTRLPAALGRQHALLDGSLVGYCFFHDAQNFRQILKNKATKIIGEKMRQRPFPKMLRYLIVGVGGLRFGPGMWLSISMARFVPGREH